MYPADKIHQLKNTVGIKWRSSNKQFIQDTPYRPKEKDKNHEKLWLKDPQVDTFRTSKGFCLEKMSPRGTLHPKNAVFVCPWHHD